MLKGHWIGLSALLWILGSACSSDGGGGGGPAPEDTGPGPDWYMGDTGDSGKDTLPDTLEDLGKDLPGDQDTAPDLDTSDPGQDLDTQQPDLNGQPYCGDQKCTNNEDDLTCARDCLEAPLTAMFIFASKGDEWASLGRMQDLLEAQCKIVVLYIAPPDDTPLADAYTGNKNLLPVVQLGVNAANTVLFEQYPNIWPLLVGPHAVLDQIEAVARTHKPAQVYLPQLAGGLIRNELAHAVGYWGVKRAAIYPEPTFFEVPVPSSYYVLEAPGADLVNNNPDLFVDQVLKYWKLIPKTSNEQKPLLSTDDLTAIRAAANATANTWFKDARLALTPARYQTLLSSAQAFRAIPQNQDLEKAPWVSSTANPEGQFIYEVQGYTHSEFVHFVKHTRSFAGCDAVTDPSHLPAFDTPIQVKQGNAFNFTMLIRNVGAAQDTIDFTVGIDAEKRPTTDCDPIPEPVVIPGKGSVSVDFHCRADETRTVHTLYIRANSAIAEAQAEPTDYLEVPFQFKVP